MKRKGLLAIALGITLTLGGLTLGHDNLVQAQRDPGAVQTNQQQCDRPDHKGMGFHREDRQKDHQEMLTLLKMDEKAFMEARKSGKTLAQIAEAQGVDRQTVVDLMVKHMNRHIDQGVADGRIPADKASDMKAKAVERAQKMVDSNKKPMDGRRHHKLDPQAMKEMLSLLNIDQQTFMNEMHNGKSLAQIAEDNGVDRQDVIDLMVKQMNRHIDQALKDGRITADKANDMKAHAVERAQKMVDRTGPAHPGK